jgi:tetratricopeptide (TPR) repeat protein
MRQLKNALAASPGDAEVAAQLGGAYLDFGRRVGDAHYAGYADAVISPWLKLDRPPLPILVLHGVTLQYQHQFQAARAELQRALARAPADAQSWLTLSTIDMTQGDYEAARADCQHLIGRENLTVGLTCMAAVRSFTGEADRAQQMLGSVEGQTGIASPSISAWILGLQAEVAGRRGDWEREEAFYRKALQFAPDDDFLLVSYADFLLDRNRAGEVLGLLAKQAQSDTAFLRLALAQQALRSPQRARYTWIMAARFEALSLRGSALYDREHARFALHLLHDADGALELARGNWQQQRAPWDARVLLEAALAAEKPQAATDVLALLDKTHLQDPVIESLAATVRKQLAAGPRK